MPFHVSMSDDPLAELRAVLGAPDRRAWHRRLRARLTPARADDGAPRSPLLDVLAPPTPVVVPEEPARAFRGWAGGGAVVVVGLVIVVATAGRGPAPAEGPAPADGDLTAPEATSEAPTVPVASSAPPDRPAVRVWPVEAIEVVGREVRRAGGRWEVGAEGDLVVVGDWDCDRLPTPGVLRPATGAVAVFDGWEATTARPVTTVTGAAAIRPGTGCGEATIVGADGSHRSVDTRPGGRP